MSRKVRIHLHDSSYRTWKALGAGGGQSAETVLRSLLPGSISVHMHPGPAPSQSAHDSTGTLLAGELEAPERGCTRGPLTQFKSCACSKCRKLPLQADVSTGGNPNHDPKNGRFSSGSGGGSSGEESAVSKAAREIAAMSEEQRDNTEIGDFPGHATAYALYEARKMLPKPSEKLKRVTHNNSFELWQQYDYIANVDGVHYGITKNEDPDAGEDNEDDDGNLKQFIYTYQRMDRADTKGDTGTNTHTDQVPDLLNEIRKGAS